MKINLELEFTEQEINDFIQLCDYRIETHNTWSNSIMINESMINNTSDKEYALKNDESFENIDKKNHNDHIKNNIFKKLLLENTKNILLKK